MVETLTSTEFSGHKKGPHFLIEKDHHVRHTPDGARHIGMDIPVMLKWLDKDPSNRVRIEAFMLIANNNGMVFRNGDWKRGERNPAALFAKKCPTLKNTDGKEFLHFEPTHAAVVLATKRGHSADSKPCSAEQVHGYVHEILKLHGLRANMARIDADLCKTCGK